jgi:hypothetical protein
MTKSWWEEYPECVDAYNKASEAYTAYINSMNDQIIATLSDRYHEVKSND